MLNLIWYVCIRSLQCSVTCGKGNIQRDVVCVYHNQTATKEEHCAHLPKPKTRKLCRAGPCPSWKTNKWQSVNITTIPVNRPTRGGAGARYNKKKWLYWIMCFLTIGNQVNANVQEADNGISSCYIIRICTNQNTHILGTRPIIKTMGQCTHLPWVYRNVCRTLGMRILVNPCFRKLRVTLLTHSCRVRSMIPISTYCSCDL